MDFRGAGALVSDGAQAWIPLTVNAQTLAKVGRWAVFGDEAGVVNWVLYASGSISLDEMRAVDRYQYRTTCTANGIVVRDALWFNMAFTLIQRTLAGFPTTTSSLGSSLYRDGTFLPNVDAHIAAATKLQMVGFLSDIMTQTSGGSSLAGVWYVAPNQAFNKETTVRPLHVASHAFVFPFAEYAGLSTATRQRVEDQVVDLANDSQNYLHTADRSNTPFGFEVAVAPTKNAQAYSGPDDGRPVFECLGSIYTAVPLYQAYAAEHGVRTFADEVHGIPGRDQQLTNALAVFYPTKPAASVIVDDDFIGSRLIKTWWGAYDIPGGLGRGGGYCLRATYAAGSGSVTFAGQPVQDGTKNDFRPYSRLRFWVQGTASVRVRIDGEIVAGNRMSWKADAPPNVSSGWEEKIMEFGNFGSLVDNIFFEITPENSTATGTLLIDDIQLDRP